MQNSAFSNGSLSLPLPLSTSYEMREDVAMTEFVFVFVFVFKLKRCCHGSGGVSNDSNARRFLGDCSALWITTRPCTRCTVMRCCIKCTEGNLNQYNSIQIDTVNCGPHCSTPFCIILQCRNMDNVLQDS